MLLAASAVLLCFDAGVRVLATNDEARFPMLARDMLRHGTWLVPWLDDAPYLNKPPLVAWLIALVSWPVGTVTQTTAVWPFLLAAVGVVMTTAWIGARLWDRTVGLTAGFVVLTMHGVFTLARTPMPDIVLCLAITGAMAAFVAAEFGGRRRAMTLCYVLLGLGFLVKGPAALLGLAVIGVYAVTTGDGSWLRRLARLRGAVATAVVIAPWWIVAFASRGAQFVDDNVVVDWLGWFRPTGYPGAQAVLSPIEQMLAIVLPWSPLVPVALVAAVRARDRMPGRAVALLVAWLGVVGVIVALSHQQRMRYYLPLCPPAALLVAAWYHRIVAPRRALVGWVAAAAVAAGLLAWEVRDDARHNALTDLGTLGAHVTGADRPLFALGVPNLVPAFYLDVPVTPVDTRAVERARLAPGYFLVEDRALSRWPARCPAERVGAGRAGGRPFSVLLLGEAGCAEQ